MPQPATMRQASQSGVPRRELVDLRQMLLRAEDNKILRIVQMVDGLPERGGMDDIIAPLRSQLVRLRPRRKLNLPRLLFHPLDPLIVPAAQWRRGAYTVPRSVLQPLARIVAGALDAQRAALMEALKGHFADEQQIVSDTGAALWPFAARTLAEAPPPPRWRETTDLAIEDFDAARAVVTMVLRRATLIEALATEGGEPPEEILRGLLALGPDETMPGWTSLLTVLLSRLPCPARILALAEEAARGRTGPTGGDAASEMVLEAIKAYVDAPGLAAGQSPRETTARFEQLGILLGDLAAAYAARPDRRQRVEQMRQQADAICLERFEVSLADEFLEPWQAGDESVGDETMSALEDAARAARNMETAGRRFGSGAAYDARLREAAVRIAEGGGSGTLIDRARLIEILRGPEAALAFLEKS